MSEDARVTAEAASAAEKPLAFEAVSASEKPSATPYFSVIVPVHNSHDYLPNCLDHILAQTFADYEVILVDDGSEDDSIAIAADYCARDPRFSQIVLGANIGASAARNRGIDVAQGTYLLLLDNDDWWHGDDALENLHALTQAQGLPDVVFYDACFWWPNEERLEVFQDHEEEHVNGLPADEAIAYLMGRRLLYSAGWGKMARLGLVNEHHIRFDESMEINEDSGWTYQLLASLRTCAWSDHPFYVYRRASSVSQSAKPIGPKTVRDLRHLLDCSLADLGARQLPDQRTHLCLSFLAYIYVILLSYLNLPETAGFAKPIRAEERARTWILAHDADPRVALAAKAMRLGGYALAGRVFGMRMDRERHRVKKG